MFTRALSGLLMTVLILGFTLTLNLVGTVSAAPPSSPPAPQKSAPGWLSRDLNQTLAQVEPILQRYGYAAIFVAVGVEGFGIPAPGETLLVSGAVAASQGRLNIIAVVLCALLAAVLGNTLGYLLGRWGGRSLLARFKVRGDRLARLERYFRRYGPGVVLVGRFFEGVRQLNGIVAGILNLSAKMFTAVNIGGAVLWVGVWGLGPFFLGEEIKTLHLAFRTIKPWVLAGSLIAFVGLLVYLLWFRRGQPPHPDSPANK